MKKKKEITHAWMTPAKLREISMGFWGSNWREEFCKFFEVSDSQLHRYMVVYRGQTIPKTVALALDMMTTLKANEIDLPTLLEHRVPIGEVEPLKYVYDKAPKPDRSHEGIEQIAMFGDDEPEDIAPPTVAATAPAEPEPEPNRTEPATEPAKKPARKPASKPKAAAKPKAATPAKKPAKAKAKA